MIKKDLVIIGSYPNTIISTDILKECILALKDAFDIAITTHYPVNEDVQKLVDYYVYDKNNDIIKNNNNPIVWFKNDVLYLQTKHINNYAYSAYSAILNAVKLLVDKYDSFYYINGDTIIHNKDIDKLHILKQQTLSNGKKCAFFKHFDGMVDAVIFFSDTKFFLNHIAIVSSKQQFIDYTNQFQYPYVPYVLESFFCQRIEGNNKNDAIIVNQKLDDYIPSSRIDVLSSFNGKSELKRDYRIYILKEKTSDRIFFVYTNNNVNFENKEISVKIENELFVLNNGNYSFYKEILYDREKMHIEVDGVSNIYYIKDIIDNKDTYIEFF